MQSKKTLVLLTNTFPFGKGEAFIEAELPVLCQKFDTVWIIPMKGKKHEFLNQPHRNIPENAKIWQMSQSVIDKNGPSWNTFFAWLGLLLVVLPLEFSTWRTAKKMMKPKNFLVSLIRVNRAVIYKREFARWIAESEASQFDVYSYWVDAWLVGILRLRSIRKWKNKIFSRAHRGDLYDDAGYIGFQTLRGYLYKHVDFVFPISSNGRDYLIRKFPVLKNKCELHYLGVSIPEKEKLAIQKDSPVFSSVSCSFLTPVKRVDLIVKTLSGLPSGRNYFHYHIGNGPLEEELKILSENLPAHVTFKWLGYKSSDEIRAFYSSIFLDCFINVSKSEGLPVSIMEALSYGIPVIATDVGGSSDGITKDCGFLISANPSEDEIRSNLMKLAQLSGNELINYKHNARELAEIRFDARKNYESFTNRLLELTGSVI